MEKLKMHSLNKVESNIEKIAALFPNCITERINAEGKLEHAIDFDILKQELSTEIVEGLEERYQFTWPDKKKSILAANAPINKTLRPCREESVDFDNTENLYIEGDNLEVLKLLQETYLHKIKMIYIDPPYNTGNDFVYHDDFIQDTSEYLDNSGQFDENENRMVKNLETNGRFHTDWLNMIYPRLKLAKDLLSDDGVIFISVDDNEQENLKKICDEIFGEANFIGNFIINSTPNARDYGHIGKMHEYTLFYAKNVFQVETNLLPEPEKVFKYTDDEGGFNIHPLYNSNVAFNKFNRPNLYYPFYLRVNKQIDDCFYEISLEKIDNSIEIFPPMSIKDNVQFVWRWGKEKSLKNLNKEIVGYKTLDNEYRIVQKMRHNEKLIRSMLLKTAYSSRRGTKEVEDIFKSKLFSFPKPLTLLEDFAKVGLNKDSIILDFFSGSATTAHAVMQLNADDGGRRKFIMVQLPEITDEKSEAYKAGYKNICEIGKERIRRAGKKIKEENADKEGIENLDTGFRVLKIDSSNMKDVYYTPKEYTNEITDIFDLVDNVKEDRTDEDLLFQVMLDLGTELSSKIVKKEIAGKAVYDVAEGHIIACFADGLTNEIVTEIAKQKPSYFVTRDSALENDSVAANYEQIFNKYSPATEKRVL